MLIFLFSFQTPVLNNNVSNAEFLPSTFSLLLGVIGGFSIKVISLHKCRIELYTVKEVGVDSGVLSKDSLAMCFGEVL